MAAVVLCLLVANHQPTSCASCRPKSCRYPLPLKGMLSLFTLAGAHLLHISQANVLICLHCAAMHRGRDLHRDAMHGAKDSQTERDVTHTPRIGIGTDDGRHDETAIHWHVKHDFPCS